MKKTIQAWRKLGLAVIAATCIVSFSGCGDYDVPITSAPTNQIDQRLLGNWVSSDGREKMKVRKLNDSIYIVSYDGDLYRAFHSDVGKFPFLSVQDIDAADRKYSYVTYELSGDGRQLSLRAVETKLVPKETKDSVSVRRLLKKNLQNAELFGDKGRFSKEK